MTHAPTRCWQGGYRIREMGSSYGSSIRWRADIPFEGRGSLSGGLASRRSEIGNTRLPRSIAVSS